MADDSNGEIARMIDAGELVVVGAELDVDRMPFNPQPGWEEQSNLRE